MKTKLFRTIIVAVLAVLVSTAYVHMGGSETFAVEGGNIPSSGEEIFVVFEESAKATDPAEEATKALQNEATVVSAEEVADSVAENGAGVLLQIAEGDADAAIETLNQTEGIAYAQPNFKYEMFDAGQAADTNDAYRNDQYYLNRWDPTFQTSCGANVSKAWQLMGGLRTTEINRSSATIAVLDTGCQVTHEDLAGNIDAQHAYDAVEQKQGAEYVRDSSGHGTHVCGIAAGVANNEKGIAGVSGNYAKVIPVNVFVGKYADTADMVTGFRYLEDLMDRGEVTDLHVINMSLGGYSGPDENDIALENYVDRMRDKDVLTVCAGGNGDEKTGIAKTEPAYPGDFEGCMCVTSLDSDGTNSKFSDYNMSKDISAPGSGIVSTMIDSEDPAKQNANYKYLNGTSMAAPLVSGIAALLWADNDQLTADEVFESITETAVPVNNAVFDHTGETGSAGAVDAAAAIEYARENFDTERENLASGTISLAETSFEYDGTEKKPEVTVTCGDRELTEGEDYIISYIDCVEPGTAQVTATGAADYIGSISCKYTIAKADIAKAEVVMDPSKFAYDGNYHFPDLTVTMQDTLLKWGTDYTPTALTDGISRGIHKVRLDGKGRYTGRKTITYQIGELPAPVKKTVTKTGSTIKKGSTFKTGKFTYKVTYAGKRPQVRVTKTTAKGRVTIPKSVKYKSKICYVTSIGASAFKNKRNITSVVVSANIKVIGSGAFKGCTKLKTVTVKTKKLTKRGVKNSLKGSKVKTIKVAVGTKKVNKQYAKKYKKIFTKKNCGRKVKVK